VKKFLVIAIPKIIGFLLNLLSLFAPKIAAKKALDLFCTPRKGNILDTQKAFLSTATQEQLELDGTSIMTYVWKGIGKTVLLAHGWESNAFRWHKLVKTLQSHNYNIVALDAPAHGDSGGQQFNAVAYSEFINKVVKRYEPEILIGHSVGGMASVFFQKKYQFQKLEKLVLLGAPSEFVNVLKNYTALLSYNGRLKKWLNKLIIERFGNMPESYSTAAYLRSINTKGLIIHDKNDKIIAYKEALLINESFKNSRLITTEGYGHSLHHDSVNQDIVEFLNS